MKTRTITNQCGTLMLIEDYKEFGVYFTGYYDDSLILGIEIIEDQPNTINLLHEGAREVVEEIAKHQRSLLGCMISYDDGLTWRNSADISREERVARAESARLTKRIEDFNALSWYKRLWGHLNV